MPSSSQGIPMAHGEQGWSAFTDSLLSPKTCHVWVSSSLEPWDMGTDPALHCQQHHGTGGITAHCSFGATHI